MFHRMYSLLANLNRFHMEKYMLHINELSNLEMCQKDIMLQQRKNLLLSQEMTHLVQLLYKNNIE